MRLDGVQFARGCAALLVLVYHAGRMVSLEQYAGYIPLGGLFNFGHAGVDFFFVLSGFIIFYVHASDWGRPSSAPRYFWRRLTRIYPIYWIVTLAVIVLDRFRLSGPKGFDLDYIFYSFALIRHGDFPILGVAWTLEHEMFFYLMFGVGIFSKKLGYVAFGAWLLVIAVGFFTALGRGVIGFAATPYHLQFFMGMAVAYFVARHVVPAPRALLCGSLLVFVLAGMVENGGLFAPTSLASKLIFGAASAGILLGLVGAERSAAIRIGRVGLFFGEASYSLYLSHVITIGLTAQVLMRFEMTRGAPGWIWLLVTCVASIVCAGLLYRFVERPIIRWSALYSPVRG